MAPVRHETSGVPPPENGTSNPSTYGTRSSKRKSNESTESSTNDVPANKKLRTTSRKRKSIEEETNEVKPPPIKKTRLSPSPPSTSNSATPMEQSQSSTPIPSSAPPIPDDMSNGSSQNEFSQPTPSAWSEPPVVDDPKPPSPMDDPMEIDDPVPSIPSAPTTRGRGRGRGRGFRGGGRWGKLKGKGVDRSTPTVTVTPANAIQARKVGRGGRRGRARKLGDARIQAEYVRRDELKEQYRLVALVQKKALTILAEKSLAMALADPKYHESLPEFKVVTDNLAKKLEERLLANQKEHDIKKEYYEKLRLTKEDYTNQILRNLFDETREVALTKVKEKFLHTYHQVMNGVAVGDEDYPYPRFGEDNREVAKIPMPPKMVHGVAAGHFPQQLASATAKSTLGDNEFEQHPANHWQSLTRREQNSWEDSIQAEEKRKRDHAAAVEAGTVAPRKGGTLFAGFLVDAVENAAGDDDAEDDGVDDDAAEEEEESGRATPVEDQSQGAVNGKPKTPSQLAQKPKGPRGRAAAGTDSSEDLAPEHATDEYGVTVPAKRGQQNKMKVPQSVHFEDHEIGVRKHIIKAKYDQGTEGIISYKVAKTPNPGFFYVDQIKAAGTNSAKLTEADFDQELIAKHKLHPKFGIALATSCNPNVGGDDETRDKIVARNTARWTSLDPAKESSKVFLQPSRDGSSETMYRTSRSEWMIKTNKRFEGLTAQNKMRNLLAAAGDLDERVYPPSPKISKRKEVDIPQLDGVIDAQLMSAVNYAEAELAASKRRRSEPRRSFTSPYTEPNSAGRPHPSPYAPVQDSNVRGSHAVQESNIRGSSSYNDIDSQYPESSVRGSYNMTSNATYPESSGRSQVSPYAHVQSAAPSMPPPPTPSRNRYDPVRDNYESPVPENNVQYHTPYPVPQPVVPPSGYNQGGILAALADAADVHEALATTSAFGAPIPPPAVYHPVPPPPPQMIMSPTQPQHHQYGYHTPIYSAPAQAQTPFTSPQRGPPLPNSGSSGRHRELRPAPTQPPPPPPAYAKFFPYGAPSHPRG